MESTLLINNREVSASNNKTFDLADPITGELVTRAAAAAPEDAISAVESAASAFAAWAATGPNYRRTILLKAADLFEARAQELGNIMMAETATTMDWVQFNCTLAAGMMREAACLTTQIKGEIIPSDKPNYVSLVVRSPVGVVLSIAPWNAPIILSVRSFAVPLACGNTVVLKGSELSPGTHWAVVRLMRDAGLPDGVLNLISNDPQDAPAVVEPMIAHPAVRRVTFTGSTRVGRIIAGIAARYLKPVLLELGGKAPLVVLDDADLDAAVAAAVFGAFVHQGQVCMSTEKIVVDEAVADEFVQKICARAVVLKAGNPRAGRFHLGSLINEGAADRVQALISDALQKGATLLAGGGRAAGRTIIAATILDRVTREMRIYHEESFGPVVGIVRVRGVEEAIRVANDTEYGLSSAIFGKDITRALSVAQRIEAGCVHINGPTVQDEAHAPLGGMKASGYGRFGGQQGINEFTEVRWISIEGGPQHYPF